jgi:methylated-DNA-[protein]-cysteine S-methyltransferase
MRANLFVITTFDTSLGPMAIATGSAGVLRRVWFDFGSAAALRGAIKHSLDRAPREASAADFDDAASPELVRRFQAYADGVAVSFADVRLELSWTSPFQKRIIALTRAIPYGQTLSYGELARRAGFPRAARAAGSVMAKNRFPLVVPCHRIVASGRRIGGFSSRRGISTKARLLAMEGSLNQKGALVG